MIRKPVFILIVLLCSIVTLLGLSGCDDDCDVEIASASILPNGVVGEPYFFRFQTTCGGDRWELQGGTLPTGLILEETGDLSGTPTEAGTFNFTVQVTEFNDSFDSSDDNFANKGFSLTILP